MKKSLAILSFVLLFSCSQKQENGVPDFNAAGKDVSATPAPPPAPASVSPEAMISEGKSLVEGADCLTCHKVSEKLVGPSYQDVAKKYSEKDANFLADKIVNGGSGNWGSVPMAAHPGMSKDNAKKMVAYILSLKK